VDEWAVGTMRFEGDIVAHLSTGIRVDQQQRLAVYGSKGSIELSAPFLPTISGEPKIVVHRRAKGSETIVAESLRGLYAYEADIAAACIRDGRMQATFPAPSWADSLANAKALDHWRGRVGVQYESDEAATPVRGGALAAGSMPSIDVAHVDGPVSRVVLGTMVADADADRAVAFGVFDAFFEAGGNTFDTAFVYGDGHTEVAFGRWVATRDVRADVNVIAKGAHTPHCFPERIAEQLTVSLDRLGTDRAEIYLMHRDNTDVPVGEFVSALEDLRVAGKIGAYGGSNWTSERFDEANAWAAENGAQGFTALSNQFSLARMVKPSWPGTMSANDPSFRSWLAERGIVNFAWSSQAGAFFAGLREDGFLAHAWFADDNIERRKRTEELAEELGVHPTTIALAWLLRIGLPVVPIIGPRSLRELRGSLRALAVELNDDQMRWLDLVDS
jgi:aryl-alcohol dehydrogenase-like predicted oxidoreductase